MEKNKYTISRYLLRDEHLIDLNTYVLRHYNRSLYISWCWSNTENKLNNPYNKIYQKSVYKIMYKQLDVLTRSMSSLSLCKPYIKLKQQ